MPKSLNDILAHILPQSDSNWKLKLLRDWPTIIGPMHAHVSIEKIAEDTLILSVSNSCWLQELHMLSQEIITTINAALEAPYIKQLRFKKAATVKKKGIYRQYPQQRAFKTVTLTMKERTALSALKDEELASALEKFLIRCYQENA